ncbi:hypothetical protein A7985_17885 [Pseudoalteromonas luteoviolacea]|uniref:HTH araC/xylS-type domain-containing protein n=1 Tax=Pseudoalteromonas luteoviolacea TaxID=43657 RepID=A0A1C0TN92_9GAMM|nr:helix-turn-helix domain-containing protein [Pseudoalteromonas luteoviolacea]MBQ4812170.1 helix-turn-helix transcriptional regulator [Pseudoalteromonas luteoviolacea]OCQ20292.1 hypothetical protein A7985_17885 [Pseudoalteromonas luteoviolacea]
MYIRPGIFAAYTRIIDTKPHQHHQIQITLPNGACTVACDDDTITDAHIIPSALSHKLTMDEGWIILIEPCSEIGQQLQNSYHPSQVHVLEEAPQLHQDVSLDVLIKALGLHSQAEHVDLDPRICELLNMLDSHFKTATNLEPEYWRASKVAMQLHLSESRFLHLFRAQVGIAWRPYLIWKRIICAIEHLKQQKSITEAAVQAGFADSAHFSRSFKRQFGLNPKAALQLVKR